MKKKTKVINVTCKGSRGVPREKLQGFQGNLVELKQENFDKLRRLIITKGFRFPVYVWNDKIIDGHQRLFVLNHLIDKEGYSFPHDVPVCDIDAVDEKEAKSLILIARSEYGETTIDKVYSFITESRIDIGSIGNISIPGADIGMQDLGDYLKNTKIGSSMVSDGDIEEKKEELEGKMNKPQALSKATCPNCGHDFEIGGK